MKNIEGNEWAGGARQLPMVTIHRKRYFVDRRLLELRRVDNPHIAIRFHNEWDLEDYLIDSTKQKLQSKVWDYRSRFTTP